MEVKCWEIKTFLGSVIPRAFRHAKPDAIIAHALYNTKHKYPFIGDFSHCSQNHPQRHLLKKLQVNNHIGTRMNVHNYAY